MGEMSLADVRGMSVGCRAFPAGLQTWDDGTRGAGEATSSDGEEGLDGALEEEPREEDEEVISNSLGSGLHAHPPQVALLHFFVSQWVSLTWTSITAEASVYSPTALIMLIVSAMSLDYDRAMACSGPFGGPGERLLSPIC